MPATLPSLAKLKPNPNWAKLPLFNRKNWSRVRFGDIVENVNERVEPSTAAEAIYVGLDDLDSGSLHIRRWGKGSDVIGTKLRFRKGDIIFGRRRAYQRKLAVAEVDGICSAHAMVARAKPKVVLPEFLPFLMMSDKFMKRAVDISVGSLSPTINWTTLKLEEFDLPPLDQQRRLGAIFWAVDDALQHFSVLEEKLESVKDSTVASVTNRVNRIELETICEVITKGTTPMTAGHNYVSKGVGFLRAENLQDDELSGNLDLLFVTPEYHDIQKRSQILPGDVLLSIAGTVGRSALVPMSFDKPLNCNQAVAIIRPSDLKQGRAIFRWLQTHDAKRQFSHGVVQGTIMNLSLGIIGKLKLPNPGDDAVSKLVLKLEQLDEVRAKLRSQCQNLLVLRKALMEGCYNV